MEKGHILITGALGKLLAFTIMFAYWDSSSQVDAVKLFRYKSFSFIYIAIVLSYSKYTEKLLLQKYEPFKKNNDKKG